MAAPYKPRKPGSLKEAVALLVERCGGQIAVAAFWGCSAQQVARLTDDAFPKAFPRIDQVMLLEAHCHDLIVTRYQAAEQDCIVEPVKVIHGEPLSMILGRITAQTGEMLSAGARDVEKGELTRANAASVLRETDDVLAATVELRVAAREVLESDAA